MPAAKNRRTRRKFTFSYREYAGGSAAAYRGYNNKPPPLRIFGGRIFQLLLLSIFQNPNFFHRVYYSKKNSACGGLLLLYFSQKAKFGPSGDRFFNKIRVFALKYP